MLISARNSHDNSINPSSSNSRENYLHSHSGHFSPHHQTSFMAVKGEVTSSCGPNRIMEVDKTNRARGPLSEIGWVSRGGTYLAAMDVGQALM